MSWMINFAQPRDNQEARDRNPLTGIYILILAVFVAMTKCEAGFSQQLRYELAVAPVFGRVYPPGSWLPLRIDARNHTAVGVDGSIAISVAMSTASTNFNIPIFVPSNSERDMTAYAYLPQTVLGKLNSGSGLVPVAIAEWRNTSGATLARSDILGRPATADQPTSADAPGRPTSLALLVAPGDSSPESSSAMRAITAAVTALGSSVLTADSTPVRSLPRHRAGYDAVGAVAFDAVSPDSMDPVQRKVLLEYLCGGGTLILAAPLGSANPTGSWLEQYCPVHVIGCREMNQIPSTEMTSAASARKALKFIKPLVCAEATGGDDEVFLRDRNYIHVAVRQIGLGRIVFTSFPINALDPSDARVARLWRTILAPQNPLVAGEPDRVAERRDAILNSMIGTPVSPWSYAAMAAIGYVMLTLTLQLLFRADRRPRAFAVGTMVAIGIFAAMIVLTLLKRGTGIQLTAARLAILEIGPKGGGTRDELMAFMGSDDANFSLECKPSAWLRPLVTNSNDPATIEMPPFSAPQAGLRSGRVDRVWQADETLPEDCALLSGARFTPDGVRIDFENRTGVTLLAPSVLWNQNCYPLASLPPGQSSIILGPKNPAGDFTSGSAITSEQARLRARILEFASTAGAGFDQKPRLAAWIDPAMPGLSDLIVHPSSDIQQLNSQTLLMSPIAVLPAAPSVKFKISGDFVTTTIAHTGQNEPYQSARREWLGSILTGTWWVGFQIPRGIGKAMLVSAKLSGDIAAPHHIVELRRGQCDSGIRQDNPTGPVVIQWDRLAGADTQTFALDDHDVDSSGCLWIRLNVMEAKGSDSAVPSSWKINSLSVGFEAVAQ